MESETIIIINKKFTRNELKQEIEALRDSTNEPTIEGILWRFGKMYGSIFDNFQIEEAHRFAPHSGDVKANVRDCLGSS